MRNWLCLLVAVRTDAFMWAFPPQQRFFLPAPEMTRAAPLHLALQHRPSGPFLSPKIGAAPDAFAAPSRGASWTLPVLAAATTFAAFALRGRRVLASVAGSSTRKAIPTAASNFVLAAFCSASLFATPLPSSAATPMNDAMLDVSEYSFERQPLPNTVSDVFPGSVLLAEETLTPAQLRIQAVKEKSAAKLAERGLSAPELKTGGGIKIESGAKNDDPYAEANALRAKRIALEEAPRRSKSASAQIEQYRLMERKSRAIVTANIQREADQAAQREAELTSPNSFNKISPIKIPGL